MAALTTETADIKGHRVTSTDHPSTSTFLGSPRRSHAPEESDLEHGSTRAPSMAPTTDYPGSTEKGKAGSGSDSDSTRHNEKTHTEAVLEAGPGQDGEEVPQEYPKGMKLGFIVIALIMAIFLVSLDMVSPPSSPHFLLILR